MDAGYRPLYKGIWVAWALSESIGDHEVYEVLIVDVVGLFEAVVSALDFAGDAVVWRG